MDEKYQLDLNSNEICRNCLSKNNQLNTLFRCDIIDGEIWSIPKVYTNVTNISITENDKYPQNICTKCEAAMLEAFTFIQKSTKSHKLLKKILKIPSDEENDCNVSVCCERKSQSTQTIVVDEIVQSEISVEVIEAEKIQTTEEVNNDNEIDEVNNEESKNEETVEYIDTPEQDDVENGEEEAVWLVLKNDEPLIIDDVELPDDDLYPLTDSDGTSICDTCNEQVLNRNAQSHTKQHSKMIKYLLSSMEYYRCSRCLLVFSTIEDLMAHCDADKLCEQNSDTKEYDSCTDYQYLTNDPLIRLFSTCKNSDDSTYSCSSCILDFEDLHTFRTHFQDEHLTNLDCNLEHMKSDLQHTCGMCGNLYKNLQRCLEHVYFHQTKYICTHDDYTHVADSFSSLFIHFVNSHPEQKLECNHCEYEAKSSNDLKEHQKSMCTARNIKCNICEKTFYKKSTLNMHMRTHTNNKRFSCTICPKAFFQGNDLANHMRTHTLERPYKCDFCEKSFKTIGQRIDHVAIHTTGYNFQCETCKKTFKTARILQGHKKIHEERQFNCEICPRKFNRRYHLTLHMKRHNKPKDKPKKGIECFLELE